MTDGQGPASSEPILELRELEEVPSAGFAGRVRRSILRRNLASDVASYAWFAPLRILLEYLGIVFSLAGSRATQGDEEA